MSKYSERHQPPPPPCAVTTCEEDGVAILTVQGRLGWFCDEHKELISLNGERLK